MFNILRLCREDEESFLHDDKFAAVPDVEAEDEDERDAGEVLVHVQPQRLKHLPTNHTAVKLTNTVLRLTNTAVRLTNTADRLITFSGLVDNMLTPPKRSN
jgi:hypothetical protein